MRGVGLLLLVGFLLAGVAAQATFENGTTTCYLDILPYTNTTCSGNGECIYNKCVCNEGWSGISEFFEDPNGCFTFNPARKAMLAMHALLPIPTIAMALFRLIQLRPLSCSKIGIKESFGYSQILELFAVTVILQQYGICVNGAILLFGETTIKRSVFGMVFAMLGEWVITANIAIMSHLFVHLCLLSFSQITTVKSFSRIIRSMKVVLIVTTVIMCAIVSVADIGASISTSWELGLAFGRLYAFTIAAVCVIFGCTIVIFAQQLLRALTKHVSDTRLSVSKEAHSSILTAASRLRKLQLLGGGMMFFAISVSILVGILPALLAYYRSLLALNLCFGQQLFLFLAKPPRDRPRLAPSFASNNYVSDANTSTDPSDPITQ